MDEEFLDRLLAIDREQLDYQEQLSYDLFRINREMSLESYQFPSHLQPVNQFYSLTSSFVQLGSGSGAHPFKTVKDYDDFLSRIDDFVVYADADGRIFYLNGEVHRGRFVLAGVPHFVRTVEDVARAPLDPDLNGHYLAPCAFEIDSINRLDHEVFGPVLHVVRYKRKDIDQLIAQINNSPEWGGELMTRYFDPLVRRFIEALRKALPDCDEQDLFWSYHFLSGALTLTFFVYVFVNVGMVSGLLPVVGVPLPFVSYGGSSVLTTAISIGLLLNVSMRRFLLD